MYQFKYVAILSSLILFAACQSGGGQQAETQSSQRTVKSAERKEHARKTSHSDTSACRLLHEYEAKGKNVVYRCSGTKILASQEAKDALYNHISVSFSAGGSVIRNDLQSRPVARSFGRDDGASCERAFINGVKKFQETTMKNRGTRVVDLVSYEAGSDGRFKRTLLPRGQFDCIVATFQSRMVMRGDLAK